MIDNDNIKEIEKMLEEIEEEIKAEEVEITEEPEEINEVGEKEKLKETKKSSDEYDVLYDKYLRINAEYDNFRKRTEKEKKEIYSNAVADVLKDILPALDNVERAMQFSNTSDPEKVLEGVKMIYSQFMSSLAKIGVEEIIAAGEQFNPEVHNAVFHEEDESQPDNTVTEVLQKGYIKGDRVIRPAMVKVVN